MAEVSLVHTTEKCIIPAIREAYIQPFDAPNWLDLRVGFFLSVTGGTDDDDTEEVYMDENISNGDEGMPFSDRYWIGLKTNETAMPRSSGVTFMGFTNSMHAQVGDNGREHLGDSLMSIAATNYWLPYNSENNQWCGGVFVGAAFRSGPVTYQQQLFPKTAATVAAGYATLLAIRVWRPSVNGQVRMSMKQDVDEGSNILFSNTPTSEIIETNLGDFPEDVGVYGPVQIPAGRTPTALYFYWPFYHSRLRVHAIGVLKYR